MARESKSRKRRNASSRSTKAAKQRSRRNAAATSSASGKAAGSARKAQSKSTGGRSDAHGRSGRRRRPGMLRRLVVAGLVASIWLGLIGLGVLIYYAHDLPDVDTLATETRKPSVTLVARDGTVLAAHGEVYGDTVSLSGVAHSLVQAVMAVEDRRFYDHFGVDPLGLARALYVNLRAGEIVQGGSTLTQQLAKNLFLTNERTIKRKVQELILALWLERKFTKDEILALYLNRVYFGAGTYGVDAAAKRYFGKSAARLNLYESAMLAGLLKAPSRYNPAANPELAHERTVIVLGDMVDAGYISAEAAERAARQRRRGETVTATRGRYFADWVMKQVKDHVGYPSRDLIVETTLDRRMQRIARRQLRAVLRREGRAHDAGNAASVVLAPNGAVRAMVGGRDYRDSQFNRATQARRQPGSAFKPFVYLAAVEDGMTPGRTVVDQPVTVDGWSPRNYAGRYYGKVTLREAFARSLNSVAVRLIDRVGIDRVARTAQRLGITTDLERHPSLALGTSEVTLLDLTGAYATFANRGSGVMPYGIRTIRTREGKVLYDRSGGGPGPVVAPRHVRRMTDLLRANVVWGTGERADPDRPAAGKTGTTQNARDAWFVGFTARLVTGVWMGNDDGSPMSEVTGGTLPADIWRRTVSRILRGRPPQPLPGLEVRVAETPDDGAAQAQNAQPDDGAAQAQNAQPDDGGDGDVETVIDEIIDTLQGGDSATASGSETGPDASTDGARENIGGIRRRDDDGALHPDRGR
jgi:penicillin-binding protein 1A